MQAYLIRRAAPNDWESISDVYRRASLSNDGDREALLANPDVLVFEDRSIREGRTRVAVDDGRVVGFATLTMSGTVAELDDLFVDPDWMRKGVARALVADAVSVARAGGSDRIEVTANSHARSFYDAVGFVADGEVETQFAPGTRMHLTVASPPGVYAATERAGLSEFLDLQREALIETLQGVSDEDARRTPTVSALSLLSLVKHSAIWEHRWFQVVVAGRSSVGEWPEVLPDDENAFRLADDDTVESVVAHYRDQIVASQEILRTFDLDAPCARELAPNLRWVAVHMIEETARHAGHADIIRETIDANRA